MYSANKQPPCYHHIGHGIVPPTCCRGPSRVYPLSIPERQAMEEYITEALNQGFIQPSTSPATSSFFFVGKKDGGLRPCIDYRQLNSQIIQQPYPLPLVPAALEELCEAQVFTKLDLRSAYNLVRIRAGDEWKTAFVTPTGHYEYRVMPYGLSISPSVFQTFMNKVFWEFLHPFVIVYINHILIYSWNLAEHRQHVQQVLHKLRDYSLYLKLEKCEFHRSSVQFLGYIISAEGVQMDQGKVSAIQEWPQPLTVKELQRFLGFSNFYRRFIKDYSSITAPLTSLLRGKPKTLCWNPSPHEAFRQLKKILSTAPLLHHPLRLRSTRLPLEWVRYCPKRLVILHSSIPLSPAERNYDMGNRELLAIKLALEEWRHWLEGSKHPFTITDHKNLQYIREAKRRQDLLGAAHQSPGSGHPGSQRTLSLLQSRYWWPSMCQDTIRYVQSCSVCAMSTSPRQLPTGKLVPLPIPQRPWSHIGVDFVTDFPAAEGNTCIIVMVERFSKMCKFFPLKGLPTAMETAEMLFQQLFRHFGLLEEIVSEIVSWLNEKQVKAVRIRVMMIEWAVLPEVCQMKVAEGRLPMPLHDTEGDFDRKGLDDPDGPDESPTLTWDRVRTPPSQRDIPDGPLDAVDGGPVSDLNSSLTISSTDERPDREKDARARTLPLGTLSRGPTQLEQVPLVGYQPPLFPWTEEPSNVPAVDHWFRESERDSVHHHLQRAVRQHKRFADIRRRPAPDYQPGDQVWLLTRDLHLRQPSGAGPGGGGSVRHSPQPPSSDTPPVAPPTRSSSPKF
ncbi:Transposon Tf2-8 polyprotein [Labeo rohita]|uniref:Gypsy retrotransposon integrase-like protein 1 n=1 Tax=Labeo rohita TaxID=84645 RepID=A0ABQ8LWJ0_LABRO|nr:Transposon Tf2-8 polyprotein [Labeo rohita]